MTKLIKFLEKLGEKIVHVHTPNAHDDDQTDPQVCLSDVRIQKVRGGYIVVNSAKATFSQYGEIVKSLAQVYALILKRRGTQPAQASV